MRTFNIQHSTSNIQGAWIRMPLNVGCSMLNVECFCIPKLLSWFVALTLALLTLTSRADQFDTLRLTWQTNLINGGGSPSSIASTANGYLSSMDTSPSRTYLWSDLPLGSVS